MTGLVLGNRYKIERRLGQDELKGTLLALDLQTQQWVVIKLLVCHSEAAAEELKLFKREAETLKTVSHPAIPRYLDYLELDLQEGKALALVQTYIAGQSLQELLNAGRILSEVEAGRVATKLLKILIDLHGHQPPIIHRDIKPSNILLTVRATTQSTASQPIDQVYLIDFKSAQNFAVTAAGSFTVVGTYGYTPPEQASGRPLAISDLYSLGATLITAMTGTDPTKLPRKGFRIEFEQVLNCSPAFADWLRQVTEPSLEKRFRSAYLALEALRQAGIDSSANLKPTNSRISLTKTKDNLEISFPAFLGKICLQIDSQQIVLTRELLGLELLLVPIAPRSAITRLDLRANRLTIWAGEQGYELGERPQLSSAELSWLAQELSQWLKVAIAQE